MDIWIEHCKFVKKYVKPYKKHMFMGQNVVKIGKKINTHPSANISAYAPCARSVSLTRKKHGCPERAFIANGHIFSRRQSHKTTESENTHANESRQKRT